MLSLSKTIKQIAAATVTLCSAAMLGSCSAVFDDLEECPRGVEMRFTFDYNIEFANAFPRRVDCLRVYVFNDADALVEMRTETTSVLADENWRMTFDLPAGRYHAVAYGGLECEAASFAQEIDAMAVRKRADLGVSINGEHIGEVSERPERPLHDLYYGALDFEVTEGLTYDRVTLNMMRDTNHIRLVLQHIDGSPVNDADFTFEILDDNTRLDHDNNLIASTPVSYTPWATGVSSTGTSPAAIGSRAGGKPVEVAWAEISTSRLIERSHHIWTDSEGNKCRGPRLRITNRTDGHIVVDIPLNNYLLMLKSEKLSGMANQEFLDRVADYNMIFFLDYNNAWVYANIIVEDWTVRVNEIKF